MIKIFSGAELKAPPGRVIIEIEKLYDDTVADGKLFISTAFEPEKHTTCRGKVVSVCPVIHPGGQTFDWIPEEVEVAPGDEVYFSWMETDQAVRKGEVIEMGKRLFISILYQSLTLKITPSGVHMLNGYCIVRPITQEEADRLINEKAVTSSGIIIPNLVAKKNSTFGAVIKTGAVNVYGASHYTDFADVSEKDIVLFDSRAAIKIQYDLHADLLGGEVVYKIQRRWMYAKILKD